MQPVLVKLGMVGIGIFCYSSDGKQRIKGEACFLTFLSKAQGTQVRKQSYSEWSYCNSTSVPKTPLTFKCTDI